MTRPLSMSSATRAGAGAAAAGLLAVLVLAVVDPQAFFHGYLAAFELWVGVPLGCAALLMLHHLTGGRWGWAIRPSIEAGALTILLLAAVFVPLLFGLAHLYAWARPDEVALSHVLQHKAPYLNEPLYIVRTAAYFLVWSLFVLALQRWSRGHGDPGDKRRAARLRRLSAAGLVVWFVTISFAVIDWFAALEPEWYSTIYGMYLIVGQTLTALALVVVMACVAVQRGGEPRPQPETLNDLGNLMLALIVLHAYLAYSQFFIIWNGNMPHEIGFYLLRWSGVWGLMALVLLLLHFVLPFSALLFRSVKRSTTTLRRVAALVLFARVLDAAWMVLPSGPRPEWISAGVALAATVLIGGLWFVMFAWRMGDRPLLAQAPQGE